MPERVRLRLGVGESFSCPSFTRSKGGLTSGLQTAHACLSDHFDEARRIVRYEAGFRLPCRFAAHGCEPPAAGGPGTRGRSGADPPDQSLADRRRRASSRADLAAGGAHIAGSHAHGGTSIVELERSVVELKGPTVEPFFLRPPIVVVLERRELWPSGSGAGSGPRSVCGGPRGLRRILTWAAPRGQLRSGT